MCILSLYTVWLYPFHFRWFLSSLSKLHLIVCCDAWFPCACLYTQMKSSVFLTIHKYLNTDGKPVVANPRDSSHNSWWRNWSLRNQGLDKSWRYTISWTNKNKNNQNDLLIAILIKIFQHQSVLTSRLFVQRSTIFQIKYIANELFWEQVKIIRCHICSLF